MKKITLLVVVLVVALALVGCDGGNSLPPMKLIGDNGPVSSGQWNVTRGIEHLWYGGGNRAGFLLCWFAILAVPWAVFLGISGWLFGKYEKPLEILALLGGTGLLYHWTSGYDLEPWLLLTWAVPCVPYLFLKGEEGKFKVFGLFTGLYLAWSLWAVIQALRMAFTYHPIIMGVAVVLAFLGVGCACSDGEAAAGDHGGGHH